MRNYIDNVNVYANMKEVRALLTEALMKMRKEYAVSVNAKEISQMSLTRMISEIDDLSEVLGYDEMEDYNLY